MSSRKRLTVAPAAERDLRNIFLHSTRLWGKDQAQRYRTRIRTVLKTIAENSDLGSERADLPSNYRAFIVGSHNVIYRSFADSVEILRVLHQRMNRTDQL